MLTLSTTQLIAEGQTAAIFASEEGDRVYKLFKFLQPGRSEQRLRAVFQAEHQAYELIATHPRLRHHAPTYYGAVSVDAVHDHTGQPSGSYLLDCCLELERLQGEPVPAFAVNPPFRFRTLLLLKRFQGAGVHYVVDAEVFDPEQPDHMKLIDFAVRDARADYPDL